MLKIYTNINTAPPIKYKKNATKQPIKMAATKSPIVHYNLAQRHFQQDIRKCIYNFERQHSPQAARGI